MACQRVIVELNAPERVVLEICVTIMLGLLDQNNSSLLDQSGGTILNQSA